MAFAAPRSVSYPAHCLPLEFLRGFSCFLGFRSRGSPQRASIRTSLASIHLAGIQMEFPYEGILPKALDKVVRKHPEAQLLVLSEYTLDGPVPESLKQWCRDHSRYLIVGGKDPTTNDNFYDTAFVVGTNGEVIFKQAKSVPIQFFKDGLPALKQEVWDSPWGKIGICICYDLSYARVTDRLVRKGAQLLIVPTMDVEDWGRHEHELHALVAPVRAAEYGLPIFRLASSGISQAVEGGGRVIAQASFPGIADVRVRRTPVASAGISSVGPISRAVLCPGSCGNFDFAHGNFASRKSSEGAKRFFEVTWRRSADRRILQQFEDAAFCRGAAMSVRRTCFWESGWKLVPCLSFNFPAIGRWSNGCASSRTKADFNTRNANASKSAGIKPALPWVDN